MEIPGEKLKLSNVWRNFDEFEDLCLMSGKEATKQKIKNVRLKMFEADIFVGDWDILFSDIIYIFCWDNKIAKKFDYNKEFITRNQSVLSTLSADGNELRKGLFNKMLDNERKGQLWNSATKHYNITDSIYLTKLINPNNLDNSPFVEITANLLDLDNFYVNFNNKHTIHIEYENSKYKKSVNLATGRGVQISKYREIPIFINAKYFNVFLTELSFNSFKYIVKSFSGLDKLFVPSDSDGSLHSIGTSRVLQGLKETIKYCDTADSLYNNIEFTYLMTDYNKFEIKRKDDENRLKNIADTENQWGDKRSKLPFSPRATERTFKDKDKLN